MKKVKQLVLTIVALALVGITIVGCSNTQQAAAPSAPKEQSKPAETQVAKATYVGSDTCKSCHAETAKNFTMTKHVQAFRPLSDYPLTQPLGEITIFDQDNKDKPSSTKLDLSKAKVYGVMMNDYIIAEVPDNAGFKSKIYRVAKLEKKGDKYEIAPAKQDDIDKDGKKDWAAPGYTCGSCHSPGIVVGSKDLGISCESCHGPGSNHITAEKKKGTMSVSQNVCLTCHPVEPSKDQNTGIYTAQNHYGTRNYFASAHYASKQLNDCLTCHTSHKANANGKLLAKDNPADICATCHAGKNYDPEKLMWKNPYDPYNHITKDHSFGAVKYEDLGDDPNTKNAIEIKNQKLIDIIKKTFPNL